MRGLSVNLRFEQQINIRGFSEHVRLVRQHACRVSVATVEPCDCLLVDGRFSEISQ